MKLILGYFPLVILSNISYSQLTKLLIQLVQKTQLIINYPLLL